QFRGLAIASNGNFRGSISDYDQAIKLDPKYAAPYHSRGWAYYNLGNYNLAVADITQAINLGPADAEMYYNRGTSYIAIGDKERAIADYQKVAAIDNGFWRQEAEKRLAELLARSSPTTLISPAATPTTAKSPSVVTFDFENGTQGWDTSEDIYKL